jgi:RNA recognition motif-containing protein
MQSVFPFQVVVGMIPPDTTEEEIRKLFSAYGELSHIHMMKGF